MKAASDLLSRMHLCALTGIRTRSELRNPKRSRFEVLASARGEVLSSGKDRSRKTAASGCRGGAELLGHILKERGKVHGLGGANPARQTACGKPMLLLLATFWLWCLAWLVEQTHQARQHDEWVDF